MNPEGDKILGLVSMHLMTSVAPRLGDNFAQSAIGLSNFMLTLVAKEYDRGADLRVNENAAIRAVFAALAPKVNDGALRAKLAAAATEKDASLRISALNAQNYQLRRLLDELLAHVEQQEGAEARAAEKQIWSLLKDIAAKRLVSLG